MKKIMLGILVLTTSLAVAPKLLAETLIPLGSSIGVSGGNDTWTLQSSPTPEQTFNDSDLTVSDSSGVFVAIAPVSTDATINMSPLVFSTPDGLVFTTADGPVTFTITGPIDVSLDNSEFLDFSGSGVLSAPGYLPTIANFSSDSTDGALVPNFGLTGSSTFGFDVTATGTSVTPEPNTLSLFLLGLLGMGVVLRRRLFTSFASFTATKSF